MLYCHMPNSEQYTAIIITTAQQLQLQMTSLDVHCNERGPLISELPDAQRGIAIAFGCVPTCDPTR